MDTKAQLDFIYSIMTPDAADQLIDVIRDTCPTRTPDQENVLMRLQEIVEDI